MADGGSKSSTTTPAARKVMVIVDTNRDSAAALQYALSHAILDNDRLILLFIDNHNNNYNNPWKNPFHAIFKKQISSFSSSSSSSSNTSAASLSLMTVETKNNSNGGVGCTGGGGGVVHADLIEEMKKVCKICKPKLEIVVEKVEITDGKDKASTILSESTKHGIELLIIGQKRSFSSAILGPKRGGTLRGFDTAEVLIENSKCTCVAVQKKGQNAGYLLNTKTHRNFWLLA